MEVLIRASCSCARSERCPDCHGRGYYDRWLPFEELPLLDIKYIICGRRVSQEVK
jgi:hypothetical protein